MLYKKKKKDACEITGILFIYTEGDGATLLSKEARNVFHTSGKKLSPSQIAEST